MKSWQIILVLIISLGFFPECKKENVPDPETEFITCNDGNGEIGRGGGRLILNDNTSFLDGSDIYIPPGALTIKTFITIKTDNASRSSLDTTADVIVLEPSGLRFGKPVELRLKRKGLADPRIYSVSPDGNKAEELHITTLDDYDGSDGYEGFAGCDLSELTRLIISDRKKGTFNASMFNSPSGIKVSVHFGGITDDFLTLSKIPLSSKGRKSYPGVLTVSDMLGTTVSPGTGNKVHAKMKVVLCDGSGPSIIKIKELEAGIYRIVNDDGSFSVSVSQTGSSGFNSFTINNQTLEDFFSGSALVFNMGLLPLPGYKYYLSVSWVLTDESGSDNQLTCDYKLWSFNNYLPWIYSYMPVGDPDTNNNLINDKYDRFEKLSP